MQTPTQLAQEIRNVLRNFGYISLPATEQNVIWMIQQIGALPEEYTFVMQRMQLERQWFLSQAIAQTLQINGYRHLPITPENITWMMQQVGAIAEEAAFVAQQLHMISTVDCV